MNRSWTSLAGASSDHASEQEPVLAVDLGLTQSERSANLTVLAVKVRQAKEHEIVRSRARAGMRQAENGENYSLLHAQIVKAKQAGVESSDLERAEAVLKTLKPDTLNKQEIQEAMDWGKVTVVEADTKKERCKASLDCACNAAAAEEEHLEFISGAVDNALAPSKVESLPNDHRLFDLLIDAALSFPEGSVWKAGGKYILSHPDRNQSPAALLMLLVKHNKTEAAQAIQQLVSWTEDRIKCRVTAVQINLHCNEDSFHAQHRDIFSVAQKEKAGRDCTCSFTTCIGTMCFTIGSSREVLMETMTDKLSPFDACGEGCTAYRERRLLQSGEAMYFNDVWNLGHTHGIPQVDAACGPRISIACLCAPPENVFKV